jgi:hypothetical protein
MATFLGKLVLVTLLFGVVEAGFDVGNAAAPAEHGGSHEIHSHASADTDDPPENLGTGSPDGDTAPVGHYCHCSTHAAALNFTDNLAPLTIRAIRIASTIGIYNSLSFPPPVPPPTA